MLSPAGTRAYVLNEGSDSISVIGTASNTVTATISLGGTYELSDIALNHDGTMAYVTTVGAIVAISTSTNTVTATIPLGFADVEAIALNPAGTMAYVADGADAALAVVDLRTGAVIASVPTGATGAPINVAVSPDGSRAYVLNHTTADSTVSVFDTSTNTLAAVIPAGSEASKFALNPAGTLIYVVALQGDISVIDATTETLTGTIPIGESSGGVAFGADGAVAYAGIAYQGGNPDASLAVIDTATSAVTATISLGGNQAIASIAVMPTAVPTATSLTLSPSGTAIQGGTVTLSATEAPATAGTMQFLDGTSPLGSPVPAPAGTATYATSSLTLGSHSLSSVFTPSSAAFAGSSSPSAQLQINPPMLAVDQSIISIGTGTVTTAPFTTTGPRLLVAFTSSDGGAARQATTVSGAGLNWTLVRRSNAKGSGTAEIWAAQATGPLTNVTVTSKPKTAGYDQSVTVVAFTGAGGIGASASASKAKGAPTVSLTTTESVSWVFGVGEDYSHAIASTLGARQLVVSQWVDPGPGETFWVQDQAVATSAAGMTVTINDTAPAGDIWNLAAVEILPTASS